MTIKYLYYIHKLNTFITDNFLRRHLSLAVVLPSLSAPRVIFIYPCPVFTRAQYLHVFVIYTCLLFTRAGFPRDGFIAEASLPRHI